jgi:hypothetical protein
MAEDWGKIVDKRTMDDGTTITFWSAGQGWIVWPDGTTTTCTNGTANPVGQEWDAFVSSAMHYLQAQIDRKAARAKPAAKAVLGGGPPVFGVTPPPKGAVGKGRRYNDKKKGR